MDKIEQIINKTFEKEIFDKQSKKLFKQEAQKLNLDKNDFNVLTKMAFDLYKTKASTDSDLFLIDWLQQIINTVNDLRDDFNVVTDIKFSPVDNCQKGLLDFIELAEDSLKICVFTISDNMISKKIAEMHNKGIDIKIITDNEKLYDKGSDIRELSKTGIQIKIDESPHHMHHKFAIVDKSSLLTGSYNWTRSAATYNQENFLIIKDQFAINRYYNEFNRLWSISSQLSI